MPFRPELFLRAHGDALTPFTMHRFSLTPDKQQQRGSAVRKEHLSPISPVDNETVIQSKQET